VAAAPGGQADRKIACTEALGSVSTVREKRHNLPLSLPLSNSLCRILNFEQGYPFCSAGYRLGRQAVPTTEQRNLYPITLAHLDQLTGSRGELGPERYDAKCSSFGAKRQ
jgi:hypothetical protein